LPLAVRRPCWHICIAFVTGFGTVRHFGWLIYVLITHLVLSIIWEGAGTISDLLDPNHRNLIQYWKFHTTQMRNSHRIDPEQLMNVTILAALDLA
jgi:hypothetical protein